jgi:hypothetical protein
LSFVLQNQKALQLQTQKHCFRWSKALQLLVKSTAFERAKAVLFKGGVLGDKLD